MPEYKVEEVYTPHDTCLDRKRREAKFASGSTDLFELAVQARIACYQMSIPNEGSVREQLVASEVPEQIQDCRPEFFAFEVFGDNGDWELTITKVVDSGIST